MPYTRVESAMIAAASAIKASRFPRLLPKLIKHCAVNGQRPRFSFPGSTNRCESTWVYASQTSRRQLKIASWPSATRVNQIGGNQFLQVMGDGRLGDGEFGDQTLARNFMFMGDTGKDRESLRVRNRLGNALQLFIGQLGARLAHALNLGRRCSGCQSSSGGIVQFFKLR